IGLPPDNSECLARREDVNGLSTAENSELVDGQDVRLGPPCKSDIPDFQPLRRLDLERHLGIDCLTLGFQIDLLVGKQDSNCLLALFCSCVGQVNWLDP